MGTVERVKPRCRACGGDVLLRKAREGFFQARVLSFFSVFPWRCVTCGAEMLSRKRGARKSSRSGGDGRATASDAS